MLKKPGVKASIVLDRLSGAVLKMSGEASTFRAANVGTTAATAANLSSEGDGGDDGESKAMQDFAAMIWNFVNSSGQLLQDMDPEVRFPCCLLISYILLFFLLLCCWAMRQSWRALMGESRMSSSSYGCDRRSRRLSLFRIRNICSRLFTTRRPREGVDRLRDRVWERCRGETLQLASRVRISRRRWAMEERTAGWGGGPLLSLYSHELARLGGLSCMLEDQSERCQITES